MALIQQPRLTDMLGFTITITVTINIINIDVNNVLYVIYCGGKIRLI